MADLEKAAAPGFQHCLQCGSPFPATDKHSSCLQCLGPEHHPRSCELYRAMGSRALKNREQCLQDLFGRCSVSPPPSGSSGHRSFTELGRLDPNQGDGQPKQGHLSSLRSPVASKASRKDFPKLPSSASTLSRQTSQADSELRFLTSPRLPSPPWLRPAMLPSTPNQKLSWSARPVASQHNPASESTLPGPQGGQQPSQSNPLQEEGLGSLLREVLSRLDLLDALTQIPPAQVMTSVSLVKSHPESVSRPSTRPSGPPSSEAAFGSPGPSFLRPRVDSREVRQPNLSLDEEDSQLNNLFPGEPSDPFHALSDAEEGPRSVLDAPLQDASFRSLLEKVANVLALELESPPEDQSRFVQLLRGRSARSHLQVPLHEIIPIALKDACRTPSSVVLTSKRIDRHYLVSDGEGPPLSFRPSAESTIALAAHDQARTHKVFSPVPQTMRLENGMRGEERFTRPPLWALEYMAHFSQHNHKLWSEVAIMAEQLPEDKRENGRIALLQTVLRFRGP
ncbi:uncharacterized protein LOC102347786 isoform X1 [Latimeria chalumnae]|uniref:uncharacterized protein LOC102347786 isoform X1 n=1 Tax=Latimeria chalumnae TaxID=7897 RepID=UPI00313C42E7